MTTDRILVERTYGGNLCGKCRFVDDDNAGCAAFDEALLWSPDQDYVRCPSCLATPSAPALSKEQVRALKGIVSIMETCGMYGPIPALRAAFPEVFKEAPHD